MHVCVCDVEQITTGPLLSVIKIKKFFFSESLRLSKVVQKSHDFPKCSFSVGCHGGRLPTDKRGQDGQGRNHPTLDRSQRGFRES